jgi:hypothetical protein
MQGAVQAGGRLPQELRIIGNPNATPDANTIAQYQKYYQQQYGAPLEAQMRANAYTSGRSDSAFAGGQLGGLQSQNAYQGFMAGQQLADNYLNRLLQARSSFAGLEGNMAQAYNNLSQQRGQGMAGFAMQDAANRNNWNMQGAQMKNNWNLQSNQQNFQNRLASYNAQQEANRWNTQKNLSLGSGIGGALGGLASAAFGPRQLGGAPLGGIKDSDGNYYTGMGQPTGQNYGA